MRTVRWEGKEEREGGSTKKYDRCKGKGGAPFTSALAKTLAPTTPLRAQKLSISAALPGSCPPNWLQGRIITSTPCAFMAEIFSSRA